MNKLLNIIPQRVIRIAGCVFCILADSVIILALFFLVAEIIELSLNQEKKYGRI